MLMRTMQGRGANESVCVIRSTQALESTQDRGHPRRQLPKDARFERDEALKTIGRVQKQLRCSGARKSARHTRKREEVRRKAQQERRTESGRQEAAKTSCCGNTMPSTSSAIRNVYRGTLCKQVRGIRPNSTAFGKKWRATCASIAFTMTIAAASGLQAREGWVPAKKSASTTSMS